MRVLPRFVLLLIGSCLGAPAAPAQDGFPGAAFLDRHTWRDLGPARGGRSAAVCGVPSRPQEYWFGATGGGVWRTRDGGRSWENVSDGVFGGSIGAVAVAPSDPNVVWVGGGEKTVRGNVSHGDGVWRSTDGGRTWAHVGLEDSRHVARLRVHPEDPDRVYAAVLGHLFGPNEERGVYRTRDGGATWERVLFVDPDVGCVDLALDPSNPRIVYASLWRVRRTPWSLESGGPGSSLWKSVDGGDHWELLSRNPGFPAAPLGIIGITVSPSDPDNLYAIVEAPEGGVFRSRDAGGTWRRVNADRELRQRAWYYTRIVADPADADSVYVLNVGFHRSKDGGRTFERISVPHGDNHDLWIAPDDPLRMIESNDGGANVSVDGGRTWTAQDGQPTAQIYRISTDGAFPYRVLGAQQDNSAFRIRSRSLEWGRVGERDWEPTAGGESGHIVAHPLDPDLVYGGSYGGYLQMRNHRTGETRAVDVWPDDPMGAGAAESRYRFQWNFPLFFSPHPPHALYAAANVLFRSDDGGASWRAISPDLTRDDETKQGSSGGPITKDNTSVEYYGTIFAAAESPREPGLLWCGSDDGRVHVSRDGGGQWKDVTPAGFPEWAQVNSLEVHPSVDGGLYVAATRYRLDDFEPYLYRTLDYGASWTRIDEGIDRQHFTRVVRAVPERAGLLFAGTERGPYASFDDGAHWVPFQANLPIVPITDLAVKDRDLIAATQGRGIWILDDLSAWLGWSDEVAAKPWHVFAPRDVVRVVGARSGGRGTGANPHLGASVSLWFRELPAADVPVALEFYDGHARLVRRFRRGEPEPGEGRLVLDAAGLTTFAWDLRWSGPRPTERILWNGTSTGPWTLPGVHRVRLVVGEESAEATFGVHPDPRSSATAADREAQLAFLLAVRGQLDRVHAALDRVASARSALTRMRETVKGQPEPRALEERIDALLERLAEHERALHQTRAQSRQDPLNFPIRLDDKLANVYGVASRGEFAPTRQVVAVRDELWAAIEPHLAALDEVFDAGLAALDGALREAGVPYWPSLDR